MAAQVEANRNIAPRLRSAGITISKNKEAMNPINNETKKTVKMGGRPRH